MYAADGVTVVERLTTLFTSCWESREVPRDLRDAVMVSLCKTKGDRFDCSSYRGITLFSIAGKILARVLLDRHIPIIAEQNLSESQCSFRANRGTVEMIFVLRHFQEKCREQTCMQPSLIWPRPSKRSAKLPTKVPHHRSATPWRPAGSNQT